MSCKICQGPCIISTCRNCRLEILKMSKDPKKLAEDHLYLAHQYDRGYVRLLERIGELQASVEELRASLEYAENRRASLAEEMRWKQSMRDLHNVSI